jgi:uroporphyrinogen decarboxylase
MNKIERVRNALKLEPVDMIPASFWFHFPPEQRAEQPMAEAHLAYYRAAQPDFLKVMNDNGYALTGVEAIERPADWRHLRPAPQNSIPYRAQLDGLKRIVDAIGDEALIITTIFNPYATGNDISGAKVTEHMRADPEAVGAGLATIAESLGEFATPHHGRRAGITSRRRAESRIASMPRPGTVMSASRRQGAGRARGRRNLQSAAHLRRGNRLEGYADYRARRQLAPQPKNLSLGQGGSCSGVPSSAA